MLLRRCLATAFSVCCRRWARRRFTAEGGTWDGGTPGAPAGSGRPTPGPKVGSHPALPRVPALDPRALADPGRPGCRGDRAETALRGLRERPRDLDRDLDRERDRGKEPRVAGESDRGRWGGGGEGRAREGAATGGPPPASISPGSTSRPTSTRSSHRAPRAPPPPPPPWASPEEPTCVSAPAPAPPRLMAATPRSPCPVPPAGNPSGLKALWGRGEGDLLARGDGPPGARKASHPEYRPARATWCRDRDASAAMVSTASSVAWRCTSCWPGAG
jgi:hypothetical protein